MFGIEFAMECKECGATKAISSVLQEKGSKIVIELPRKLKCVCGAKDSFNILSFEQRKVKIYSEAE